MPWDLKRYQQTGELHFVTFCCYHRRHLLGTEAARDQFIIGLERARKWRVAQPFAFFAKAGDVRWSQKKAWD